MVDDLSHEGLRTILREEGVSLQVIKTWKTSTDPDFEEKKNRVLELYDIADGKGKPKRGDPTVVLCMDEFGPLNLLPRPDKQWAPRIAKGEPSSAPCRRRGPAGYTRTQGDLTPADDLNKDKLYGHVKTKKDRTSFLALCRYLRSLYPQRVRIAIVFDNFSPHLSTKKDTRVGEPTTSSSPTCRPTHPGSTASRPTSRRCAPSLSTARTTAHTKSRTR